MEKQLEYFDVVANNQKQVLNNMVSVQNDLRNQWLDSLGKVQDAVTKLPGLPDTSQAKEAKNYFTTWFDNMLNSTQAFSEEVLKTQENWINAYEKQVAINREVFKNFIDVTNKANSQLKAPKA